MGVVGLNASTVMIIGGGPTGLGAAIEARMAGLEVILVEKRECYSRQNTMSLSAGTLELFEKWNATIPLLEDLDFNGTRRGFLLLKDLEDGLALHADLLGVQRMRGEFIDFAEQTRSAIIQTERGNEILNYDILVGADGLHSRVREKLKIDCQLLNQTLGGVCMVQSHNPVGELSVEFQPHNDLFAKKVCVPNATVLFFQNRPFALKNLSLDQMTLFASELGWRQEAMKMGKESCIALENIPIYLQRAIAFSDPLRGVIILGDAASTASFFTGSGVNYCFKTTEIAGELFRTLHQENSFEQFNQNMEKEVECFIQMNLPYF